MKTPSLYLYLQARLSLFSNKDEEIDWEDAYLRLVHLKITKDLFPKIIKEMEKYGLIKRVNRFKLKLINKRRCKRLKLKSLYNYSNQIRIKEIDEEKDCT